MDDGFSDHEFVAEEGNGEADMTVNTAAGEVIGRVTSSSGTTFLIRHLREANTNGSSDTLSHFWIRAAPNDPDDPHHIMSDVVLAPDEITGRRMVREGSTTYTLR